MSLLWKKFKEVAIAVLPLVVLVLILHFTLAPLDLKAFIIGAVLVIVGEVLFFAGIDNSIITMGELIGSKLTKFKKIALILAVGFLFGFLCTIAEPDLHVLGSQVNSIAGINAYLLIAVIALGVGIFIVLAMMRTLFKLNLKVILLICYSAILILSIFTPPSFRPLSFDSGGVTTGPITVPFILALGIGIASVKGGGKSEDSFGMTGLASVGPIIAMMILGIIYGETGGTLDETESAHSLLQILAGYKDSAGSYQIGMLLNVAIALLPMTILFLIFQMFTIKLPAKKLIKILLGVIIVYVGLVLFLSGVEYGFSSAAQDVGRQVAASDFWWILIPIGLFIGVVTVYTEPAISVLGQQVEDVTAGQITKKSLIFILAIAIAIAVMLAVIKSLFGINVLWFVVPGYLIAMALMLISPMNFTAIAFDSGGVASGPMTATFSLPLMMGICAATGGDIMTDAFGCVAIVAMMPLIVVQAVGAMFRLREKRLERQERQLEAAEVALHPEELDFENDKDFSDLEG